MDETRKKIAVITGGGTGIGLACAKRLKLDGFQVICLGLEIEKAAIEEIDFRNVDVTDDLALQEATGSITKVDALINAAGMLMHEKKEYTPEGFRRVVEVNLTGTHLVSNILKDALEAKRGAIVNFASMFSFFGSPLTPAYAASKAGVQQLTRSFAVAWASSGIRVNAVAPGWIETQMTVNARGDAQRRESILKRIPAGNFGTPDDVANAVSFLVSDQARYITGVTLPVDGGYLVA
jgi:NAD(P)-dependent dehydrogenase (short-subunit alcohol dehydrogenase family)